MLVGSLPPTIGDLNKLVFLEVTENRLDGDLEFLSPLSNCRNLSTLAIASDRFTGPVR
jgi:Leucine-rich repeat (LRR) protein